VHLLEGDIKSVDLNLQTRRQGARVEGGCLCAAFSREQRNGLLLLVLKPVNCSLIMADSKASLDLLNVPQRAI